MNSTGRLGSSSGPPLVSKTHTTFRNNENVGNRDIYLPNVSGFVSQIDPVKTVEAIRELNGSPFPMSSPSYPTPKNKVPTVPIGQILQTPADRTEIRFNPQIGSVSTPQVAQTPIMQPKQPIDLLSSYQPITPRPTVEENRYERVPRAQYTQVPEYPQTEFKPAPPPVNPDATDPVQDSKIRADYRVKFSILREAYPKMEIPEPKEDQSIPQIIEMYKSYVKRIHIDSSVEQNSTYLVIMWLLIEVVGSRFFKFPMKGYFKNQFKYMGKYQMLLIELGERNFSAGFGEGWPVEARLLLMALFNAVIFVMVKSLADKMSLDPKYTEDISETINNYLTKGGEQKKEALRMADEARADHIPVPQPQPADPLGGFGGMLGNLIGMFGGGNSSSEESKPEPKPQAKKPTSFGSRTRKVVDETKDS